MSVCVLQKGWHYGVELLLGFTALCGTAIASPPNGRCIAMLVPVKAVTYALT